MSKNFYITTPIYYPSAKPHMGHAYSSIVADFFARFKKIQGYKVFFLTGTDEHGQKIQRAAKKRGMDPLSFCDEISKTFRDLSKTLNLSNTDFSIIDNNTIQYGLSAIKNIGKKASDVIVDFREKNGIFKSIFDVAKIKPSINKKVLESLILSGACDELVEHRSEMFNSVDIIIDFINKYNKTENIHQSSLFSSTALAISTPNLVPKNPWSKDECLKYEISHELV